MSSRLGNAKEDKVRDLMADQGWFAGDPCESCGSTETYGEAGAAGCRSCGAQDWDDD